LSRWYEWIKVKWFLPWWGNWNVIYQYKAPFDRQHLKQIFNSCHNIGFTCSDISMLSKSNKIKNKKIIPLWSQKMENPGPTIKSLISEKLSTSDLVSSLFSPFKHQWATVITCSNFRGCSSTFAARNREAVEMLFRWKTVKEWKM